MINFELGPNDKRILDAVRSESLIARKYARYYDENEHEFPPDKLDEAKDHPSFMNLFGQHGSGDSSINVISTLVAMGQTWGDYSVRLRRQERGLGNSALQAAGTEEQKKKWGHLILAMAITEPGCGSDPSRVTTTAVLDGDEWVINGEKIFV
ncbi:MAG TPA: acyl-CoA dehydrogenase, partial [Terriglobales bacterium]|nr:acyl-CoA dehydrogenase [Terriglobales bacterium]